MPAIGQGRVHDSAPSACLAQSHLTLTNRRQDSYRYRFAHSSTLLPSEVKVLAQGHVARQDSKPHRGSQARCPGRKSWGSTHSRGCVSAGWAHGGKGLHVQRVKILPLNYLNNICSFGVINKGGAWAPCPDPHFIHASSLAPSTSVNIVSSCELRAGCGLIDSFMPAPSTAPGGEASTASPK